MCRVIFLSVKWTIILFNQTLKYKKKGRTSSHKNVTEESTILASTKSMLYKIEQREKKHPHTFKTIRNGEDGGLHSTCTDWCNKFILSCYTFHVYIFIFKSSVKFNSPIFTCSSNLLAFFTCFPVFTYIIVSQYVMDDCARTNNYVFKTILHNVHKKCVRASELNWRTEKVSI